MNGWPWPWNFFAINDYLPKVLRAKSIISVFSEGAKKPAFAKRALRENARRVFFLEEIR